MSIVPEVQKKRKSMHPTNSKKRAASWGGNEVQVKQNETGAM
jgi:hypothetical protein